MKEFVAKDMSFAQKVLSHVRNAINEIKNIFKKLVASGNYEDIAAWQNDLDALEKLNDMMVDALNNIEHKNTSASEAEKNTSEEVGDEVKYSYKGKAKDGRSIYKTNYKKGTPKATKQQDLISLVQNVWSKKPITLTVIKNGTPQNIVAKFNPELTERSDLSKMAFGNRKGAASDQRITLDLASDFYQIAEESKYVKSKKESGKDYNPAHHGVTNWEYFVTNLIYEDENGNHIDCFMNIDVKEKADGHYFYSFAIEKGTAPQTLLAVVTDDSATVPIDSISEKGKDVNKNVSEDVVYSTKRGADQKQKQLDIINETNPAPNTYSTWIRTVDDIKTLSETLEDEDWEYEVINPDLTRTDIQNAIESGEITVYSSYPIENGVFVSPSRMEAESYSGDGRVYEKTVDINDVAWIDPTQGQYAKVDDINFATKRDAEEEQLLTREVLAGYNYNGIRVSEQEYAMVRAALIRKNASAGKLKPIVGVFAHDYYYICINHDWGDFTIVERLSPDADQELIDYSIEVLRNEEVFTDDQRDVSFLKDFQRRRSNRRRRGDLSSFDTENRRNERKVDEILDKDGGRSNKQGAVSFGVGNFGNDDKEITPYTIDDNSPLSYKNRAKPNPRSSINWVYKAGLFSVVENKLFHQKISEINQGSKAFKKNADGEYMLPIENKIVFTNGDYDAPYISKVIEVLDEYATNFEKIRDVIFDEERGKTGHREAVRLVKQVFGDGLVVQYENKTDGAYGWADRKRKGRNRRAVINRYIQMQNGAGNTSGGGTNQSVIPSTKREPSVSEEASDYIQDTKEYREVIDIINQRYNLTNRKKLSPKAIDRFAGKLLAQAKSKYDRGALTERLNALFDYMANSGNELVIKNGLAHIILTTKMLEVKK